MTNFDKLNISLRYWLHGISTLDKEYIKCLNALEFASKLHIGLRKDGITPEFEHQLTIAHYVRTLISNLLDPVNAICTALLHDTCEDYNVSYTDISNKFGNTVGKSVEALTKVHRNEKKNIDEYFDTISKDATASIIKGADRIHNLQSMNGVFSNEKKISYIEETEGYIIPTLKKSRRLYPEQELAYENIKLLMKSQIELINTTIKNN